MTQSGPNEGIDDEDALEDPTSDNIRHFRVPIEQINPIKSKFIPLKVINSSKIKISKFQSNKLIRLKVSLFFKNKDFQVPIGQINPN